MHISNVHANMKMEAYLLPEFSPHLFINPPNRGHTTKRFLESLFCSRTPGVMKLVTVCRIYTLSVSLSLSLSLSPILVSGQIKDIIIRG